MHKMVLKLLESSMMDARNLQWNRQQQSNPYACLAEYKNCYDNTSTAFNHIARFGKSRIGKNW